MRNRHAILTSLTLLTCCVVLVFPAIAQTDYENSYFSDRLTREHRAGNDVDEWVERGSATINASPHFEDGARLTAWAGEYVQEDDYEFAIASAVYFFEIPSQAQYIEILVRYRGEPHQPYIEDYESVAGRVWIRNTRREHSRRGYDDKHADETRYGDTFALRAKRRSETIKIAAARHIDSGFLELHVVAQDGEQLDIEYIDISAYRGQRKIEKHHRYARRFHWNPWHRYTYLYFYDGPCYYPTNQNYYIRWSYPIFDHHYFAIRYSYGNYLHRYYTYHPRYYHRSYSNYRHGHSDYKSSGKTRTRLNRWSQTHESVRRQYTRSRFSSPDKTKKQERVQTRVRAVIETHRAAQPILANQVDQNMNFSSKYESSGYQRRSNSSIAGRRRAFRSRGSLDKPDSASHSSRQLHSPNSQSGDQGQSSRVHSNTERRTQLYKRSQTYLERSGARSSGAPSFRSSAKSKRPHSPGTSRGQADEPSSSSHSRTPAAKSARSTKTSPSNDDDEREKRSSGRANSAERLKHRRK